MNAVKIRLKLFTLILFALTAALRLEAQFSHDDRPHFIEIADLGGMIPCEPIGAPVRVGKNLYVANQTGQTADYEGGISSFPCGDDCCDGPPPMITGVYAFKGGTDGAYAESGLTVISHTLWGVTYSDGANNYGTLFRYNIDSAAFSAPLSFGSTYGTFPQSLAVGPDGNLYGTANNGGMTDNGTVFKISFDSNGNPSWGGGPLVNLNVINGANARGGVTFGPFNSTGSVQKDGVIPNDQSATFPLYGVTVFGGTNGSGPGTGGNGTIFKVNSDGSGFSTLLVFSIQNNANGFFPAGGMALAGNTLYGTTTAGGNNYSGVIFKMDTTGSNFTVIKQFSGTGYDPDISSSTNSDGSDPYGDLILSGSTLYGTTYNGGPNGGGVVFSVSTNGNNFAVLHSFATPINNGSGTYTNRGGGWTKSGLHLYGRTLYGTTPFGGTNGGGTIFALVLPPPPSLHLAPAGGSFTVSWPSFATNFVLQQNLTLNSLTWSNFTGTVSDDGTNKSIAIMPTGGSAFFRLLNTNGP
jgi:uncharacterized repeat protein (TIGR03803 family)